MQVVREGIKAGWQSGSVAAKGAAQVISCP